MGNANVEGDSAKRENWIVREIHFSGGLILGSYCVVSQIWSLWSSKRKASQSGGVESETSPVTSRLKTNTAGSDGRK